MVIKRLGLASKREPGRRQDVLMGPGRLPRMGRPTESHNGCVAIAARQAHERTPLLVFSSLRPEKLMGMSFSFSLKFVRTAVLVLGGAVCLSALTGCQVGQTVSTARLIQHQAMIDPTGLKDSAVVEPVKVHISAPQRWEQLDPKKHSLYMETQWRSPSKMTGVGVAYVRLPLPIPARSIAWLAQKEYSKKADDGKILGTWDDALGRPWFEAENSRYHVRGYIVSKGFDAWIIYCGYKTEQPPSAAELGVAARCLETIVPTPYATEVPQKSMAVAN
jgi:hypothetical protein